MKMNRSKASHLKNQKLLFYGFNRLVAVFFIAVLCVLFSNFLNMPKAAAACAPSPVYGTDTLSVNVPATGTYFVWTRLLSQDGVNNQIMLSIDGGACSVMGASMSTNTWTWVNTTNGSSTPLSVPLTSGIHSIVLYGNQPGVGVDEIQLLTDSTCVPSGTTNNCTLGNAPLPTVSLSSNPTTINSGGSSTLSWSSVNANSCSASSPPGWTSSTATTGSQSISPTSTTAYAISCSGAGGTSSASVTVTVNASPTPKTGDINGDNSVNITDLSLLLSSYGQTTTNCVTNTNFICDLSTPSDGVVNIFDLSILLSHYGT
jgi:hypothetical protein